MNERFSDIFRRVAAMGDPVAIRQLRIAEALEAGTLTVALIRTIAKETGTPVRVVKKEAKALKENFHSARVSSPRKGWLEQRRDRLNQLIAADKRRRGEQ